MKSLMCRFVFVISVLLGILSSVFYALEVLRERECVFLNLTAIAIGLAIMAIVAAAWTSLFVGAGVFALRFVKTTTGNAFLAATIALGLALAIACVEGFSLVYGQQLVPLFTEGRLWPEGPIVLGAVLFAAGARRTFFRANSAS